MHLSYNDVPLEIVTLDRVERRSILTPDETSVLYVEWAISLSCVYHPELIPTYPSTLVPPPHTGWGGTSIEYQSAGDKNKPRQALTAIGKKPTLPVLSYPGPEYPIQTDRELIARLSIPRKPLIIHAYDLEGNKVVWLESPRKVTGNQYLPQDAQNGPIVQANVVTATLGNGVTFGVQMEIKTWVPPCPDGSDRLILAHRWQMSHTRDENYYLTRVTAGEIYFHGGLKEHFKVRADAVSRQLLHPIPLGFQRYPGVVTQSPDGLVLRYSYADVDQKVVFDPGRSGATQIAISENVVYRTPFQGQEFLAEFARGAISGGLLGGIGGAVSGGVANVVTNRMR